ncbi:hypothetical protein STRIP9103_09682, partial [Streptomyces ipomoeae 91-03]
AYTIACDPQATTPCPLPVPQAIPLDQSADTKVCRHAVATADRCCGGTVCRYGDDERCAAEPERRGRQDDDHAASGRHARGRGPQDTPGGPGRPGQPDHRAEAPTAPPGRGTDARPGDASDLHPGTGPVPGAPALGEPVSDPERAGPVHPAAPAAQHAQQGGAPGVGAGAPSG